MTAYYRTAIQKEVILVNWQPSVIVDGYEGKHRMPCLALDATGGPYISFCVDHASAFGLIHVPPSFVDVLPIAFLEGRRWHNKVLDSRLLRGPSPSAPPNFNYPSLAIDRDGHAHVSYVRKQTGSSTNTELLYATSSIDAIKSPSEPLSPFHKPWDPMPCERTTVAVNEPTCCALTLDQSGTPYIVWRNQNGALFCAHNGSDGWVQSTVNDSTNLNAGKVDIVLDESDKIHISYYNKGNGSIGYACSTDQGSSWTIEIVKTGNPGGQEGTSIACVNGVPSITYGSHYPSATLEYATRVADGRWVTRPIDAGAFGAFPSLAVSAGQLLTATYHSMGGAYGINYAYQEGGGRWVCELVDDAASLRSSLAINSSNLPCLAYEGSSDLRVRYTQAVP
jgi:hypothetical protein